MASYYAIAELFKEVQTNLSNYINRCIILYHNDSWFNVEIWVARPGSKIPKIIEQCAKIGRSDSYKYFLLEMIQKMNALADKKELESFDLFLLDVFAVIASLFPPIVDTNNIHVYLTQIIFHPVFKKCPESIFNHFERLIARSEVAGNNIFPMVENCLQKQITQEEFFSRIKIAIASANVFLCFLESISTFEEALVLKTPDTFYNLLYDALHHFSTNNPAEHKKALEITKEKPVECIRDLVTKLMKKCKNWHLHWPLAAFLLPFCIGSFEKDMKKDSKTLFNFINSITSPKQKKAVIEYSITAICELAFYHANLGSETSPLIQDVLMQTEAKMFADFQNVKEPSLLRLLPVVAAFQVALTNGRQLILLDKCRNSDQLCINAFRMLFNDYPTHISYINVPKTIQEFMYEKGAEGNCDMVSLLLGNLDFNETLLFSSSEFSELPIPTRPIFALFISELIDPEKLIKYVQKALETIFYGNGFREIYQLLKNVFLPHDEWIKIGDVDSAKLLQTIDTILSTFSKVFINMYRKSLYNVAQVAEVFLSFEQWICFISCNRSDETWKKSIPNIALTIYDVILLIRAFGLIEKPIIDKLEKGIEVLSKLANAPVPTKPSQKCQTEFLTLPFMQLVLNQVPCLSIAFKYANISREFISKVFQMTNINSSIVESFKYISDEAAPMAETFLRDLLEKQIITKDFMDVDHVSCLADASCIIAKATTKANIVFRREILSNFLRIIVCADYGGRIDKLAKLTTDYCAMVFDEKYSETHVDVGVLRLLLQFMSKYSTKRDRKPGILKTSIQALGSILGCVNISHALSAITQVNQTKFQIFLETNSLIYSSLSVLDQMATSGKNNKSVNDCIINAITRLLQKNFKNAIGLCFQIMTEKSSDFQRMIIKALASVFNPKDINQTINITKVSDLNYRIQANSVDVTFEDLVFDNTISYNACLNFLSYFDLQIEYFKFIMKSEEGSTKVTANQNIFMQAFFDFCFSPEDLKEIYSFYLDSDADSLIRSISVNRNIVKAYQFFKDNFIWQFTDNFLRKFLNKPSTYCTDIEKVESYPIGAFMQSIKMSTTIDQILLEAAKSISDNAQLAKDFNSAYRNFLEFCEKDASFDKMNIYGEDIINEQIVEMRNSNVFIHLGTDDGVEKFVAFLDRCDPQWKNPRIIFRFIEMHFKNTNPSDILIDLSNSFVSKETLGLVANELRKLNVNIRRIYLFNPSDEICETIESSISHDLYPLFNVITIDKINEKFKGVKIPYSHILTQTTSNFIFKSGENKIVIGDYCTAIIKDRVFLNNKITSVQYVRLTDPGDGIDETCIRAAGLKNEYNRKHVSNTKVMPFDTNFIFAEILAALCTPFPQTQAEVYSIMQNVARNKDGAHGFIFCSGAFTVPYFIGEQQNIEFFPHFLQKLLETYPEQVQEYYYVIVMCLNKLHPSLIPRVAQTIASFEEFGKSVTASITNKEVACGVAERLIELNSLETVIPLIRKDTCSYLISASNTNSLGYSLTLAKALTVVLPKANDVATTDELLSFCVISAKTCLRSNFGVFARLSGIVHLLSFKIPQKATRISAFTKPGANFIELILNESISCKSLFSNKPKTPFYLYCRSFAEGPTEVLFTDLMQWALNGKQISDSSNTSFIEDIEYCIALLERIVDVLPKYANTAFILALISTMSKDESIRKIGINIVTKCFAIPDFCSNISKLIVDPEITKTIQIAANIGGAVEDGLIYIMSVLFPCFIGSSTSNLMLNMLASISKQASVYPSLQLPFITFTQDEVKFDEIPAIPQAVKFLAAAFYDRRAYNQVARICKALCILAEKNPNAVKEESQKLISYGIEYIAKEVNPVSYKGLSSLLSTLLTIKNSSIANCIVVVDPAPPKYQTEQTDFEKAFFAAISALSTRN